MPADHKLQQSVFKWIGKNDPFKTEEKVENVQQHRTVTAEEVAKKHGVPRDILQEYVGDEIDETEACNSLPFTLFFVVSYACMVIAHDDAAVIRAVEDSIDFDIDDNANFAFDSPYMAHKTIHDVNSHGDFWSFMRQGMLPLLFVDERPFGEGRNMSHPDLQKAQKVYTAKERGVMLHYNRILGAVKMSQERAEEGPCDSYPPLATFYNALCTGEHYELDPEMMQARLTTNPQRIVWFPIRNDLETTLHHLLELEAAKWLDRGTTKVEILIPIYTAEYGLHTLISVNFFFSAGGHIWKKIIPLSTYASWYTFWYYIIYDIIWVLCLMWIFYSELNEVIWTVRQKDCMALWNDYIGFWNTVDWVSVAGGFLILILWYMSFAGTDALNEQVSALGAIDFEKDPDAYDAQTELYHNSLHSVVHYVHKLKLVLACYPLIIVFRLFKAFAAQPRLAVVTNTLLVAGVDLLHFMIVFISIFISFALSGLTLFGRQVSMFTTFPRAINTCFRAMLGDFDWDALSHIGRIDAGVWLWLFTIIVSIILLNMLLAIVMDGYTTVKARAGGTETLVQEAIQTWKRWWGAKTGRLVPLNVILECMLSENKAAQRMKRRFRQRGEEEEDAPRLIGRDCKAVLGQKVIAADEDIRHFVGPGRISAIGAGETVVRVLHEDGELRDYNTGRNLEFELQLAEGEKVYDLEDKDDDEDRGKTIITVERLQKLVTHSQNGYRMSHEQSLKLVTDAIEDFYNANREDADMQEVLQITRRVNYRTKKVKKIIKGEDQEDGMRCSAPDEVKFLRQFLKRFFEAVDRDRLNTVKEIRQLQKENASLRKRLYHLHPGMDDDKQTEASAVSGIGSEKRSQKDHKSVPSSQQGSRNGSVISVAQSDSGSTRAPNGNGNGVNGHSGSGRQPVPRKQKKMDDAYANGFIQPSQPDEMFAEPRKEFEPGSTRKRWSMTSPTSPAPTESQADDSEDLLAEIESLLGETVPSGPSRAPSRPPKQAADFEANFSNFAEAREELHRRLRAGPVPTAPKRNRGYDDEDNDDMHSGTVDL